MTGRSHERGYRGVREETGEPFHANVVFPPGTRVINRGERHAMTVLEINDDDRLCELTDDDGKIVYHSFPVESLHRVDGCVRARVLQ